MKKKVTRLLVAFILAAGFLLGTRVSVYAATGTWKHSAKGYWYSYSDGSYAKDQWVKISGRWYSFDSAGYLKTGWQKHDGVWYYTDNSGPTSEVEKKKKGKVYLVDKSGTRNAATFNTINVGNTVIFGHYEQDNNRSNGKEELEWIVLDKKNGQILILSKNALDIMAYYENNRNVTWEDSLVRWWMNSTFLNTAFSRAEQSQILTTKVVNNDNSSSGVDGGNNTNDKIFSLSIDEVKKYFGSDYSDRLKCQLTAYATAKNELIQKNVNVTPKNSIPMSSDCRYWWLRSPGMYAYYAATVSFSGSMNTSGNGVYDKRSAVRPALWITP